MRRLQPQNKAQKRNRHDLHGRGLQKRLEKAQCHGLIRPISGVPPPTACCRPIGERYLAPAAVRDGTINRPEPRPAAYYFRRHPPPGPGSGWLGHGAVCVVAVASYRCRSATASLSFQRIYSRSCPPGPLLTADARSPSKSPPRTSSTSTSRPITSAAPGPPTSASSSAATSNAKAQRPRPDPWPPPLTLQPATGHGC